jgi:hypothetical protein
MTYEIFKDLDNMHSTYFNKHLPSDILDEEDFTGFLPLKDFLETHQLDSTTQAKYQLQKVVLPEDEKDLEHLNKETPSRLAEFWNKFMFSDR